MAKGTNGSSEFRALVHRDFCRHGCLEFRHSRGRAAPATARRAVTLVELLLVVFLTSLALGTVAILLRGAIATNSATQRHRAMAQSLQRLAVQFRDDVHTAESVEANGDRLTVQLPGGAAVEYALDEQSLERTEPADAGKTRREWFALPEGAAVEFTAEPQGADDSSTGELVSLAIEFPTGADGDTAKRRYKIEAARRGL